MLRDRIFLFGALIVGFTLRCANIATTIVDGRLFPFDSDPAYHLRRIFLIINNFPQFPNQDPLLAFPRAAQVQWPPLFDGFCALLYLPFSLFSKNPVAFEYLLALLIPLLSITVIYFVYRVAKKLWGTPIALIAAWILAFIPSHIFISMFGRIDHHLIEHLFIILALLWAANLDSALAHQSLNPPLQKSPRTLRHSISLTALILMLLLSTSMIYYAYFSYLTLGIVLLAYRNRQKSQWLLRTYATTWLIVLLSSLAFISLSPLWQRFDPWDIQIPGLFWMTYTAITWLASSAISWWMTPHKNRRQWRLFILTSIGALACLLLLLQKKGIQVALQIIQRNDYNFLLVEENNGLFSNGIGYYVPYFFEHITAIGLLAIIGLFFLARNLRRQTDFLLSDVWILCLACGVTLQSLFFVRFLPTAAIFVALLVAYAAKECHKLFGFEQRLLKNPLVLGAIALVCISLFTGIRYVQNLLSTDIHYPHELMKSMAWLKSATTPASDNVWDPQLQPSYGVVAHPAYGGFLTYYAERPTLDSPFDTDVTHAGRIDALTIRLAKDENTAWKKINDARVKYILTYPDLTNYPHYEKILFSGKSTTTSNDLLNATSIQYLETRLHFFDGSFAFYRNDTVIPALQHLRLVYQSRDNRVLWNKEFPTYKIFEAVPGTRLKLNKPLTSAAMIELNFSDYEKRPLFYRTYLPVGSQETRLPYATNFNNKVIIVDSPYRLMIGNSVSTFNVTEEAVQQGLTTALEIN